MQDHTNEQDLHRNLKAGIGEIDRDERRYAAEDAKEAARVSALTDEEREAEAEALRQEPFFYKVDSTKDPETKKDQTGFDLRFEEELREEKGLRDFQARGRIDMAPDMIIDAAARMQSRENHGLKNYERELEAGSRTSDASWTRDVKFESSSDRAR